MQSPSVAGYHSLWQILFVTIPVLGALHGIVVVFVVREQKGDKTLSGALKAYFCPSLTGMHINPHIHTLGKSMKVMQALAGLGLCLVVLVAATPGVWACFDPLVRGVCAKVLPLCRLGRQLHQSEPGLRFNGPGSSST